MKFTSTTCIWILNIILWIVNVGMNTISGEPWGLAGDWCATIMIIICAIGIILFDQGVLQPDVRR